MTDSISIEQSTTNNLISDNNMLINVSNQRLTTAFIASLAVVFLLAMHIFMHNLGGAALELPFNLAVWAAFSFSIGIGLYYIGSNQQLRYSKLTIALFLCLLCLTLPVFYPQSNFNFVSERLSGMWAGLIFFIILQQFDFTAKQKLRLLWLIVLAVIIEACFGFVQYFILEPGNLIGYNTKVNRPYGIFQQPNVMASFLATGLVISAYLVSTISKNYSDYLDPNQSNNQNNSQTDNQNDSHQNKRFLIFQSHYLLYLVPLLTVPLLIVLASRTGWLGATLAVLCILPFIYRYAKRQHFIAWCLSLLLGLGFGFSLLYVDDGEQGNLVESRANIESPRQYTFPQTWHMFKEKPLLGYGMGNFEAQYTYYTAERHQQDESYHPGLKSMDHPHNELLFWAIEGGIVPVIAILLCAFYIGYLLFTAKNQLGLACFAMMVPILLHTQLEYPLYHSAVHWLILIMLIYWLDQQIWCYKADNLTALSKSLLKIASPIIPIMTSVYMITALHTNHVLNRFERSNPRNVEILRAATNIQAWEIAFNWDVFTTYLILVLNTQKTDFIDTFLPWALEHIKHEPRVTPYKNIILAYQAIGDQENAEKFRAQASYLFPTEDFSQLTYVPPKYIEISNAISTAILTAISTASAAQSAANIEKGVSQSVVVDDDAVEPSVKTQAMFNEAETLNEDEMLNKAETKSQAKQLID